MTSNHYYYYYYYYKRGGVGDIHEYSCGASDDGSGLG